MKTMILKLQKKQMLLHTKTILEPIQEVFIVEILKMKKCVDLSKIAREKEAFQGAFDYMM